MAEAATFREMANALEELGLSSQELGDTELLARRLREAGWSSSAAEFAVIRMRRRQEIFADLEQIVRRAQPIEEWVRAVAVDDPPRWGVIFKLTWALLWMKWPRRRLRGASL